MGNPAAPILSLIPGEAWNEIKVNNPSSNPPVFENFIDRRISAGHPWLTRHLEELDVNATWVDYEIASGQSYQYRARAQNQEGITTGPVLTAPGRALVGTWVHHPSQPALTLRSYPYLAEERSEERTVGVEALRFLGRSKRVFETASYEDLDLPLSIEVPFGPGHAAGVQWWRDALRRRSVFCYRDGRGRLLYVFAGPGLKITDTRSGSNVQVTLSEADYVEGVFVSE